MSPTLVSIQVGKPAIHDADTKRAWESGIFKAKSNSPIWLGKLNLEGDGQQDLTVHGGPFRAVLAYSADHYPIWRDALKLPDFPHGAFGENFTIAGLDETSACLGDIYRVGEATVRVTQPRQPCWKLGRRWNMKKLIALVHSTNRGGWYFSVIQEGAVEAGQAVTLIERPFPAYPIARVNALMNEWESSPQAYAELAEIAALTPTWRAEFARRAELSVEI